MAEWKIRRRQGSCSACEREFEDGERHASLLRIEEDELARLDLCAACWRARDGGGEGDLFWWFTRHQANKKRTVALDLASLERLFLELEGREEQRLREVRYLLCLLLMRKKRLKLERVQRGRAGEALVVRRPRRKEELVVHVFDFTTERIDELRTHLQEILEGAGPTDEEAPEQPADEAPTEDSVGDADWEGAAEPLSREAS
jgi:hypothetical protein